MGPQRFRRRRASLRRFGIMPAVIGGLAIVVLLGIGLFVAGGSGSKITDLGTTLIGSAVVGAVLVLFEHALARRTQDLERAVSFAAAPPAHEDEDVDTVPQVDPAVPSGPGRTTYSVRYLGWQRDTSRVDVYAARLRVLRNGEYFQFFTAVLPGLDVTLASGRASPSAFQAAVVDEAVIIIADKVRIGTAPADDPLQAIELRPDIGAVLARAEANPTRHYTEDELVATFEI